MRTRIYKLLLCAISVLVVSCTSDIDRNLVIAAADGDAATVERLISEGANIESYALDGLTPLMAAAKNGHLNVVELLIAKDANPNAIPDGDCCTPLDLAASNGELEVVKYLLAHGGRINADKVAEERLIEWLHYKKYTEIERLIRNQIAIEDAQRAPG